MFIARFLSGLIPLVTYGFTIYTVLRTLRVLEEIRDALLK